MDFLSGIIGAGANLLGGLLTQSKAKSNAVAAQNLAFQYQQESQQNAIPNLVAGAKAAGINPLAALGVSSPGFSAAIPEGADALGKGVAAAGQDLGRAALAAFPKEDKAKVLEEELLRAKIANVNADTTHQQAVTSGLIRSIGAPGSPPGVPLPRPNVRNPNFSFENNSAKPLYEVYSDGKGGFVHLPTGNASTAMQNWASMPAQLGVAAGEIGHSLGDAWDAIGGSVKRGVQNFQSGVQNFNDYYYDKVNTSGY